MILYVLKVLAALLTTIVCRLEGCRAIHLTLPFKRPKERSRLSWCSRDREEPDCKHSQRLPSHYHICPQHRLSSYYSIYVHYPTLVNEDSSLIARHRYRHSLHRIKSRITSALQTCLHSKKASCLHSTGNQPQHGLTKYKANFSGSRVSHSCRVQHWVRHVKAKTCTA